MSNLQALARALSDIKELKDDVAKIQVDNHVFKIEIAKDIKLLGGDVRHLAEETEKLLRLTKLVDRGLTDVQIVKEELGLLRGRLKRLETVLEDPIKSHYRREALKTWGSWPINNATGKREHFYRVKLLSKLKPVGFDLQRIEAVNDLIEEGVLVKILGGRLKWGSDDAILWSLEEAGR